MTNFVGFAPSLFGVGKFAVDQYSLSVWDEERPEIPLLDDVEEQGWSSQYLFTRYGQSMGDLRRLGFVDNSMMPARIFGSA